MIKKIPNISLLLFVLLIFTGTFLQAQQRFPKPEFDSGYLQPDPTQPEPRAMALEYFDVLVLLAVLSLVPSGPYKMWHYPFSIQATRSP